MTASPLDADRGLRVHRVHRSVEQARLILGVSDDVCRKAIDAGKIEHLRLGRNIRVLSTPLKRKVGLMS